MIKTWAKLIKFMEPELMRKRRPERLMLRKAQMIKSRIKMS